MDSLPHSSVFDGPQKPEGAHKQIGLILGVVAVVVLLAGGGTVFAAMQGWIQLPFGLLAPKPPSLAQIGMALAEVHSGKLTTSFTVKIMERQEGTPVIPKFPMAEEEGATSTEEGLDLTGAILSSYLASDTTVGMEFTTQFQTGEMPDVEGQVKGSYKSSGVSLSFDAAYRRVGADAYVQLREFPFPILDFPAIAGDWVRFDGTTDGKISLLGSPLNPETQVWEDVDLKLGDSTVDVPTNTLLEREERASEELRVLRDALFTHNALTLDSAAQVRDETGARVWRMNVSIDPAATRDALVTAVNNRPDADTYVFLTDDVRDRVQEPRFLDWLTAVSAALSSTVDVDPQTSLPVRQTFSAIFASAAEGTDSTARQYRVDVSYTLKDVNVPISVRVPENAIELRQAVQRVLHQSDDEVLFGEQREIITSLRSALMEYQEQNGRYPETLAALMGLESGGLYTRRVVNIPNDRYTGQAFVYAATEEGQNYTLTYEMRLSEEGSDYTKDQHVTGTNTATPSALSEEAAALKDEDDDGLTALEESRLGTSDVIADSDRDGFTDKEEVDAGFDPLTNSKTQRKYGPF